MLSSLQRIFQNIKIFIKPKRKPPKNKSKEPKTDTHDAEFRAHIDQIRDRIGVTTQKDIDIH